jgi:hypothetical protein
MAEGWPAWSRAFAWLRGRANPLSRWGRPGRRRFFLRGRGCACARGRLASGGRALPGRGRHQRPGRLGRRTARIDPRKWHPAQNRRRRSAAPDAGRSRSRLSRAGPARAMARWPRHKVSSARAGPGSLGARRCLRLLCRAGISKWAGTGARAGVGEALIDAGLARYEPSAAARACRSALLAAEAGARASGLGLWADPYYAIIAAADRLSFAEKAGSSVIVEGRITGIASRRPRITLYFGPRQGWDFSVTILPRNSKTFEAAYASLAGLTGQTVRVRGLLDTRFGPQIEIADPDEVEAAGQGQDAAAPGSPAPR